MTNIVGGLRTVLAARIWPSVKSTLPDTCAKTKNTPVLLAARSLPTDLNFLQGQRLAESPGSSPSLLFPFSPPSTPSSPFLSRLQSLSEFPCEQAASVGVGAAAQASCKVLRSGEDAVPSAIPSLSSLRACAEEQPALSLCNEKGQLMAQPMAAVLRQLSSVVRARAPKSPLPMPAWLRRVWHFDTVHLRRASAKVSEMTWKLDRWVCCLAASGEPSISLADTAALSRLLGKLMRGVSDSDPLIKDAFERLHIQVEGSAAAQHRAAIEERLYRSHAAYLHPGARSEQRLELGVGAAAGLSAGMGGVSTGATAGITLGVSGIRALGNDDEGYVQESRAFGCSLAGYGVASLGGAAKALAAVKASMQKTAYVEYEGVRHLIESRDSRVQHARLGEAFRHVPFKLRSLADLTKRQDKAAFQEAAFARAMGGIRLPGAEQSYRIRSGLGATPQKPPAEGVAMRIAVQGDAEASVGLPAGFGLRAGLSGGVAATHVQHDVRQPFWVAIGADRPSFRHLDGEGLDDPARADPLDLQRRRQVIQCVAVRLAAQLDCEGVSLSGSSNRHERASFALSRIYDRGHLLRILQGMEDQFDFYCLAAREVASGKREAAALMRDFERIWQVKGRQREIAYIQSVCLAHNAIALRLRQLAIERRARGDARAAAHWLGDWARLDAFWNKLCTPDLPHRQSRLLPYITFRDVLSLTMFDRHIGLSLSASGGWSLADSATGLGAGANVSVSVQFRRVRHPNYLREGDYIDLKFDFGGSSVVAVQYGVVLQALNGLSSRLALPPELLEHAFMLTGTTPLLAASVEGGVQLMLRLFRPAASMDDDDAYRLQFARVLGRCEGGLSAGEVTVSVGPVSASIEAGAGVRHIRVLREWLGDATLTYVMLRYNRMHTRAPLDEDDEWSDFTLQHRTDFKKLFAALGDPQSAVSKEAARMMEQVVRGTHRADRPAALVEQHHLGVAMHDFRSSGSELDFDYAMLCLERVLARQFVCWKEAKAVSRTHWTFDDRIRRVR